MIRTIIIDDEELLRSGLRMLVGADERIDVVGEAADGRAGLELIASEKPDVVLLDLRMPVLDGVGVLEELRGWINPPKVLVLTAFDTDDLVRAALAAGAVGFLVKSSAPDVLAEAIVATHAGRSVLSPGVLERVVRPAQGATGTGEHARAASSHEADPLALLSVREREVALLIAEGLTNPQIARRLYLSLPTVKTHVARILDKLGVENRVQVATLLHGYV